MFAHPWDPACLSCGAAGRFGPNPGCCQRSRRQPSEKVEGKMSVAHNGGGDNSPGPGGPVAEKRPPLRATYHAIPTTYHLRPTTYSLQCVKRETAQTHFKGCASVLNAGGKTGILMKNVRGNGKLDEN